MSRLLAITLLCVSCGGQELAPGAQSQENCTKTPIFTSWDNMGCAYAQKCLTQLDLRNAEYGVPGVAYASTTDLASCNLGVVFQESGSGTLTTASVENYGLQPENDDSACATFTNIPFKWAMSCDGVLSLTTGADSISFEK